MFEKLFSKLKIGINMFSSPVDPTADKKQKPSSSKASEVGKYINKFYEMMGILFFNRLSFVIFVIY